MCIDEDENDRTVQPPSRPTLPNDEHEAITSRNSDKNWIVAAKAPDLESVRRQERERIFGQAATAEVIVQQTVDDDNNDTATTKGSPTKKIESLSSSSNLNDDSSPSHTDPIWKYWLARVQNNDGIDKGDPNTWYGLRLKDAPKFIQNDNDIVMAATYNSCGFAFEFASPELRQDTDFVFRVVQQKWCGYALKFASPEFQQDKQVVVAAVKTTYGYAFEFASPEFRQAKDFVLQVVQQGGNALQFASPELQQDKQVVMAAVKSTCGYSFQFASPELRQDKDFVLQAVQQGGFALKFVSPEFQNSKQVVMAAVNNNPDAIRYVNENLKRDPDVLIAAGMFDEDHDAIRQHTTTNTRKIVFSTRFALNDSTYSEATNFTRRFKQSENFKKEGDFIGYSPNAFDKKTCDPDWTNFDHPCRGTTETCQYKYNILTDDGRPTDDCCWRYSFRSQLQEAKDTGGFMLQLVETEPTILRGKVKDATLGNGQKIELDMANTIGVKVFHVYCPEGDNGYEFHFEDRHINMVTAEIASWYHMHEIRLLQSYKQQDMSVTVIRQLFDDSKIFY